jgi:hypothetical protein
MISLLQLLELFLFQGPLLLFSLGPMLIAGKPVRALLGYKN